MSARSGRLSVACPRRGTWRTAASISVSLRRQSQSDQSDRTVRTLCQLRDAERLACACPVTCPVPGAPAGHAVLHGLRGRRGCEALRRCGWVSGCGGSLIHRKAASCDRAADERVDCVRGRLDVGDHMPVGPCWSGPTMPGAKSRPSRRVARYRWGDRTTSAVPHRGAASDAPWTIGNPRNPSPNRARHTCRRIGQHECRGRALKSQYPGRSA